MKRFARMLWAAGVLAGLLAGVQTLAADPTPHLNPDPERCRFAGPSQYYCEFGGTDCQICTYYGRNTYGCVHTFCEAVEPGG